MSGPEGQLWSAYQADRSLANRNAMVEFYLPLLGRIAGNMATRLACVPVADLRSDATAALIRTVETFDPTRGFKFSTHAEKRLRGAMVDAIRERDPVPRLARSHAKHLTSATREWLRTHAEPPTDRQLARRLRISLKLLASWRRDCVLVSITEFSIDSRNTCPKTGTSFHLAATIEDRISSPPAADQSNRDWWDALLLGLLPMQRAVVILYWRYAWTMKRIGLHMGVVEGRISQVHKEVLRFLKVARRADDFADISSQGRPPKLLQMALPICHSLRRQHLRTRRSKSKRAAA